MHAVIIRETTKKKTVVLINDLIEKNLSLKVLG